ncbi:MAG: hypothetical protein NT091_02305 [Candidatus Falkowbacteria bacterium]|nr:hypothetical protein [Candidatus Falkowbacteria bacterium]
MNTKFEQFSLKRSQESNLSKPIIEAMENLGHDDYAKGSELALEMFGELSEDDKKEIARIKQELGIE